MRKGVYRFHIFVGGDLPIELLKRVGVRLRTEEFSQLLA